MKRLVLLVVAVAMIAAVGASALSPPDRAQGGWFYQEEDLYLIFLVSESAISMHVFSVSDGVRGVREMDPDVVTEEQSYDDSMDSDVYRLKFPDAIYEFALSDESLMMLFVTNDDGTVNLIPLVRMEYPDY